MEESGAPPLSEPLVIERTFPVSRTRLWQAVTQPAELAGWWGPAGMKTTIHQLDLQPGGSCHYSMQAGNGPLMWGRFTYQHIQAPERIAFISAFSDEAGGLARHPLTPGWPLEVSNTWTLTEADGATTLTLEAVPVNASPDEVSTFNQWHGAVRQGTALTFNQLAAWLEAHP